MTIKKQVIRFQPSGSGWAVMSRARQQGVLQGPGFRGSPVEAIIKVIIKVTMLPRPNLS